MSLDVGVLAVDPAGWQRDRYLEAIDGVRRDQGLQHARVLADRMVARGWLSADDVTWGRR